MKKALIVLLSVLLLLPKVAYAGEEDAEITVFCKYKDQAISGVEFTAYLLAEATKDTEGKIRYELVAEAASYSKKDADGIERLFDGMTAAESTSLAEDAAKAVSFTAEHTFTATTGKSGQAEFVNLPMGVYVIKQTGAKGEAKEYTEYTPFLCVVPYESETGELLYSRTAMPKSEVKAVPPTEDKETPPDDDKDLPPNGDGDVPPVKTDDEVPLGLIFGVSGGCVLLLAGLLFLRFGFGKKEKK